LPSQENSVNLLQNVVVIEIKLPTYRNKSNKNTQKFNLLDLFAIPIQKFATERDC
jgi:hypothetical protein